MQDQIENIQEKLKSYSYPQERVEIIPADEVVEMHEPATVSLRKKKRSSISLGIQSLKDKEHDAFISAGNTGAVVAAATVYLGWIIWTGLSA